jgi:hypothetical protein
MLLMLRAPLVLAGAAGWLVWHLSSRICLGHKGIRSGELLRVAPLEAYVAARLELGTLNPASGSPAQRLLDGGPEAGLPVDLG